MEHLIEVSMHRIHQISEIKTGIDISQRADISQAVWHEAGHAVVSEIFCPGSVSLVSIGKNNGSFRGITNTNLEQLDSSLLMIEAEILISLAGRAAVEIIFGTLDVGSNRDIHDASHNVAVLIESCCMKGFQFYTKYCSESLLKEKERAEATLLEQYYVRAKEIIRMHRGFWEATARVLAKKGLLFGEDIAEIRKQYESMPVNI